MPVSARPRHLGTTRLLPLSLLTFSLTTALAALPAHADSCTFLNPVGGNGVTPIVTKTVSAGNPLPFGRPNWNTDFFVTQQYRYFKLFFTADSSVSATYPIQAYLKFTDGSNLQVYNSNFTPTPGTGGSIRVAGYPGKLVSQVNIKVGATDNMAATGFTYRISVQGCF
ncbi:MAG: hypothetical protein ACKO0M_13270 [Cyanobium sp.]